MAINKARIEDIFRHCASLPEPERQVAIVRHIEHLLANPKTKFGTQKSIGVALDDNLSAAHRPELSAEERAKYVATHPSYAGVLNPDLDQAELAREVRRHKRIAYAAVPDMRPKGKK